MHATGLENMQLHVDDLAETRRFYRDVLELDEINVLEEARIAIFEVGDFILRFREREEEDHVRSGASPPVDFIGIELDSFDAVDAAFDELADVAGEDALEDVRERYSPKRGPYGFYLHDPDGYRLKIYHYHEPD